MARELTPQRRAQIAKALQKEARRIAMGYRLYAWRLHAEMLWLQLKRVAQRTFQSLTF